MESPTETKTPNAGVEKLRAFWRGMTPKQKRTFAERCETKPIYITQICGGHSRPSGQLSRTIERESYGKVTAADLRPDLYGDL